jgi:hypothetical protein
MLTKTGYIRVLWWENLGSPISVDLCIHRSHLYARVTSPSKASFRRYPSADRFTPVACWIIHPSLTRAGARQPDQNPGFRSVTTLKKKAVQYGVLPSIAEVPNPWSVILLISQESNTVTVCENWRQIIAYPRLALHVPNDCCPRSVYEVPSADHPPESARQRQPFLSRGCSSMSEE